MELLNLFFFFVLVFLGFVSIVKRKKRNRKLPPGPCPLPVIGNLLELGDMPHISLANLAKTYGPIMSLKLGQKTTYVISSETLAKEAFQKHDLVFSTRSMPDALHDHDHDQLEHSVVWMPVSDKWRDLRKFLKTFIFHTQKLNDSQNLRREKVHELMASIGECCDKGVAIDIGQIAFTTFINMLSNTMFSIDLPEDLSKEFRDVISNIMVDSAKPNLPDFFPILEKIDPQGLRRNLTKSFTKMFRIVTKLVDERVESRRLSNKNYRNDFLDELLNMGEDITSIQIERLITDLFIAGTDTTSSTVEWAMAEILRKSEILKTAKAELEETIGRGKPIEESDIQNLPYLRAIVIETLRKHPPGPLMNRNVEMDVEICEYTIPKGSQVLLNLWAMRQDPSLWERPSMFEPKRFMGSDIDARGHEFVINPFGVGRRSCPGVPLVSRIVPVMIGSLLNSFDWKLEGGIIAEELDMKEKFGFTLQKAEPLRVVPTHI